MLFLPSLNTLKDLKSIFTLKLAISLAALGIQPPCEEAFISLLETHGSAAGRHSTPDERVRPSQTIQPHPSFQRTTDTWVAPGGARQMLPNGAQPQLLTHRTMNN